MNGGKENLLLTESMNVAYEWLSSHLLAKYSIFVFIAFVFACMFDHFELFYTESDSATYLISALVQSQAAIISIVITLTFIAVQLIFPYSPQAAIVAFKKNRDMWMLLFLYGLSIFYGLFVLRMIPNDLDGSLSQIDLLTLWGITFSLECRICFVYCLGILTFVAMALYLPYAVDFLKPDNIIKILSHNITESKILKHIKSMKEHEKNRTIPIEEDPIQPIMGIIHGSVMKYDIATVRCGLEAVIKKAVDIIDFYSDDEDVPMYFCDHLGRACRYAMRAGEGESAVEIIGFLKDIGISAIETPSDKAAKIAAQYIEMIGTFSAENKLKYVTSEAVRSLGLIGSVAVKKEREEVVNQVVESLGSVGMVAMVNELEDAAWKAVSSLEFVGRVAVKKEFTDAAKQAALHLGRIGRVAAVNRFEHVTNEAAMSIGSIGKVAVEEEPAKRYLVMRAIESLGSVGEIAAEQGLKIATLEAARQLGLVGKVAVEKGLEFKSAVERVIEWLRFVGEIAVGNNRLKDTIFQVAFHSVSIGIVATEKELKFAAHRAASCLAELTISSKEIVENAIKSNRLGLEENDREFFDKFMDIYEQYREELQTQNPDRPPMR